MSTLETKYDGRQLGDHLRPPSCLRATLIVTVFSDLPSLRLFGWLNPFAKLAPLAADLATFLSRLARQIGGKR
jgi:hypothetical protein